MQGEFVDEMKGEPSLIVWDVAIDNDARRKGLGRHLLVLLELVARQTRMRFVSLPVMAGDDATRDWCGIIGVFGLCLMGGGTDLT